MNKLTCLLIAVFLYTEAHAQGTSLGGAVLKLPEHALAGSLGDASMTSGRSLAAGQFNPANIYRIDPSVTLLFSHASWFQDISAQHLSVGMPLPLGRLVVGIGSTSIDNIELRDRPGPFTSTFSAKTAQFRAGWGVEISTGIVAGISASYIYDKLYVNESSGLGVDLGVLYNTPLNGLTLGGSLVNVGSLSAFRTERVDLPQTARFGAGYRWSLEDLAVEPALGLRLPTSQPAMIFTGVSAEYAGAISVRLGWQSGNSARAVSFGFGAVYGAASLEYASVPFSADLGTTHMISIALEL